LYGAEFVEHFFGLARMILPNFTYTEMLRMVQNTMVRQRILLSGNFKENREKQLGVGYVLDFDPAPLSPEDFRLATVKLTTEDINKLVELAYKKAEIICKDLLKIPVARLSADKHIQLVGQTFPIICQMKKKALRMILMITSSSSATGLKVRQLRPCQSRLLAILLVTRPSAMT
jgi:hypothetical protein